jgi:Protein of unknown function (DUF1588)/Protein of unknown function (DUF1592)/Protein of unknown function (DUF1595)/Protein of unknown function (DUF1587)
MGSLPGRTFLCALPCLVALIGCQGKVEGAGSGGRPVGATGNGGSGGSGSGSSAGNGSGGGVTLPPDTEPAALLPTRIRRLTNAEFENSARSVVGNTDPVATGFVPDARQSGFTLNDAQIVDSVLIKQISGAAAILAAQVRTELDTLAPCTDMTQAEACASSFIQSFATRAYRRPLGDDEAAKLLVLYHAGADGAAYADGIEEVATGIFQSAAFLYLTETGNAALGSSINLTPYEIASQISYLLIAGPPPQPLLDAAAENGLSTPDQRIKAINTAYGDPPHSMLQTTDARDRFVRVIREWLGTDQLENTAKDSTVYPSFATLKSAMVTDATDFINAIGSQAPGTRTLQELFGADWTSTKDPGLLSLYGATTATNDAGFFKLTERRGILNQGAFLSVYAHASETGPVLRGVALLRRITCIGVPSPATLNITVVPLVPDPTKTMRERLSAHVTDKVCAGCHTSIDNFGLAFEIYDGMGNKQTTDQGQPIDSTVTVANGKATDLNGAYPDSNALALTLSTSPSVRECFARNVFRASSGRSDNDVQASEDDFVKYWLAQEDPLKDENKADIINTMVDYIQSPTFNIRRTQ